MMNAGKFLVPAVDEITVAAEFAIAARAAEKPDTDALTDRPALDARTQRIDPPDDLVAWDARAPTGNWPSTVPASEWQTPRASTRTRTSPRPGACDVFSVSSSRPALTACTAR
jgi:hypothetical protein